MVPDGFVDVSDGGMYLCKAVNEAGASNVTFNISIEGEKWEVCLQEDSSLVLAPLQIPVGLGQEYTCVSRYHMQGADLY